MSVGIERSDAIRGEHGSSLIGVGKIEAIRGGVELEITDRNGKEDCHGREGRHGSSPVKGRRRRGDGRPNAMRRGDRRATNRKEGKKTMRGF